MPIQPRSAPWLTKEAGYALAAGAGTALLQSSLKQLREVGYSTELLLFLRYTGALLISVFLVLRYVSTPVDAKWGILSRFRPMKPAEQLLRGVLMLGTTVGVFLSTEYLTVAQLAALSLATWPLFALLLSPLFGERVSKLMWVTLSTLTSLGGLGLLLLAAGVDDLPRFVKGTLIVCGASVCTALNQHFGRRANRRGENQYVTMFYQSLLGTPLTAVLWFVPIGPFAKVEFDISQVVPGHLPWLGLVAVLGFLPQLWYLRAAKAPISRTTPVTAFQPPIAGVFDFMFDDIVPSRLGLLGLAVMLVGAMLGWPATFAQRKQPPKPGTN
jgi:drug/metabolite transporter (DMT)-like permease